VADVRGCARLVRRKASGCAETAPRQAIFALGLRPSKVPRPTWSISHA
jgi:hypothetical protein